MKKLLSMALVLVMILSTLSMFATGAFAAADKWDGKTANIKWYADDPSASEYTISTAAELYGLSVVCQSKLGSVKGDTMIYYKDNGEVIFDAAQITETTPSVVYTQFEGKTVKLAGDIDLAGKPFLPIGISGSWQGVFDGQNHTISNVTINTEGATHLGSKGQYYYGLFSFIARNTAEIKNLKIKNEILNIDVPATPEGAAKTKIWAGGVCGSSNGSESYKITDVSVEGVTVNISTSATFPSLELYLGGIYGVFKSTAEQKNITVTDFSVNGLEDLRAAVTTTFTAPEKPEMYFVAGNGTGAFTNCSVTKGVYVPEDNNQGGGDDSQGGNTGSNPETGDMTLVLVALAAISAVSAGAVLTFKKREVR